MKIIMYSRFTDLLRLRLDVRACYCVVKCVVVQFAFIEILVDLSEESVDIEFSD